MRMRSLFSFYDYSASFYDYLLIVKKGRRGGGVRIVNIRPIFISVLKRSHYFILSKFSLFLNDMQETLPFLACHLFLYHFSFMIFI